MALLIHKVEKRKVPGGKKIFSFEMTPEKRFQGEKRIVTFKIDSIDVHQTGDILIADRDQQMQSDLENCLHILDYRNVRIMNNTIDLFSYVRKKKFVRDSSVFCFCDYKMLMLPDWSFLQEKFQKNRVDLSIVALTPENIEIKTNVIYNTKIVEILEKPVRLSHLRKILFRYVGPPLKKIAQ